MLHLLGFGNKRKKYATHEIIDVMVEELEKYNSIYIKGNGWKAEILKRTKWVFYKREGKLVVKPMNELVYEKVKCKKNIIYVLNIREGNTLALFEDYLCGNKNKTQTKEILYLLKSKPKKR